MIYLVILGHLSIILTTIVDYINPEINMHIPMMFAFIIVSILLFINLDKLVNCCIKDIEFFNKKESDFIKAISKQAFLHKRIEVLGTMTSLFTLIVTFIPFIIIGFMYGLYVVTVVYMLIRLFRMFIIYRHRNILISLLQHPNYFNA
jgi:hypothetical protein